VVGAEDLEVAARFRAALETAVRTGDHEAVLELVAPDVEWVTPQRTLSGVDELRTWRLWGSSAEAFDFEFAEGDWVDHGDGRLECEVKQVYRVKETGDLAYERVRRVEVTVQDGRISRYELRFTG
jgi:ketosteroid isomerase-like protein